MYTCIISITELNFKYILWIKIRTLII